MYTEESRDEDKKCFGLSYIKVQGWVKENAPNLTKERSIFDGS